MRLRKLQEIVPNEKLQCLLWGPSFAEDKKALAQGEERCVRKKELVAHLFTSEFKERNIPLVVQYLTLSPMNRTSCNKFLGKIIKIAVRKGGQYALSPKQIGQILGLCSIPKNDILPKKLSLVDHEEIKRVALLCGEEMRVAPMQPSLFDGKASNASEGVLLHGSLELQSQYDQFPDEWCSFENLEEKARRLRNDGGEGQKIIDKIRCRVGEDSAIHPLSMSEATSDMSVGRDILGISFPGKYVCASLQNFFFTECPEGEPSITDFFDTIIKCGIRIIICLDQHGETNGEYYDFWEKGRLQAIISCDGWKIEKVKEKALAQMPRENAEGCVIRVIESTLMATRGGIQHEVNHFHFDGRCAQNSMPCEELLAILYGRIEELNIFPQTQIVISGKGGQGVIVAVGWHLRRYIDMFLPSMGKDCQVNIPEIIYREFYCRCSEVIEQPEQVAYVYSMAAQYYQRKLILSAFNFSSFAKYTWFLCHLEMFHGFLAGCGYSEAVALQQLLNDRLKMDPAVTVLKPRESYVPETPTVLAGYNAAYDKNRIGREFSSLCLNWSDIATPLQRYFAGGCPYTIDGVSTLFVNVLSAGVQVMVSLHQPGDETLDRYSTFWKQETLQQLHLPEGWAVEPTSSRVIEELTLQEGGTRIPQLVESTLLATVGDKKTEIKHFLYDGWVDGTPPPSMDLFRRLMKLVQRSNPSPHIPIVVNCKAGIGRTGIFLVSHFLLNHIISQLQAGTQVEMIQVNVAEAIYTFRKERKGILGGNQGVCEVVSYLAGIYEEIQVMGAKRFLAEYRPISS